MPSLRTSAYVWVVAVVAGDIDGVFALFSERSGLQMILAELYVVVRRLT